MLTNKKEKQRKKSKEKRSRNTGHCENLTLK